MMALTNTLRARFRADLNGNRRDVAVQTTWKWADTGQSPLPIPEGYERIVTGSIRAGDCLLLPYSRGWKTLRTNEPGRHDYAIGKVVSDYHCVIRPIPGARVGDV